MPTRVLLSVKPKFAEAILAGDKTFEFRRLLFKRDDVRTIVLYASSPICMDGAAYGSRKDRYDG